MCVCGERKRGKEGSSEEGVKKLKEREREWRETGEE